jgi:hypothetical protein
LLDGNANCSDYSGYTGWRLTMRACPANGRCRIPN